MTIDKYQKRVKAPAGGLEPAEPYLTIAEACALCRVHRATFYRWLADPDLGLRDVVVRLPGGRIRVPASRFQAWLEGVSAGRSS